ncbi:hypothetical protein [Mycolicibacterium litorale]|uniref:Uncharacterized protein n=1 Tax=Mycolicibacterium litorale TaxID=758802 RepID=A0AAD1MV12_9MYCO|nr:hypothetical protein [Mycolicibacterium litorale]MCV7417057.1 hypothetical protein [Mycolicibacterium litorale]TDY04844.1 hypothetical protein BCL50_3622 [Mycolicibacterium litorale]BBY18270.1 hypothetical protein MLIT_38620 [Mycolicibacterium litorale]
MLSGDATVDHTGAGRIILEHLTDILGGEHPHISPEDRQTATDRAATQKRQLAEDNWTWKRERPYERPKPKAKPAAHAGGVRRQPAHAASSSTPSRAERKGLPGARVQPRARGRMPMRFDLRIGDNGRPACKYGQIARTVVSRDHLCEIRGVGPLIVFNADHDRETRNLGHFAVKYWVTDGNIAHIKADNGEWLWRLEPAHWWNDPPPQELWSVEVLLGRWPDLWESAAYSMADQTLAVAG